MNKNYSGGTVGFGNQNYYVYATADQLNDLQTQVNLLKEAFDVHFHDGILGQRINLFDILGTIQTSATPGETTARTGAKPQNIYDQIFIDTSTATKKLYIYSITNNTWYSTTIS